MLKINAAFPAQDEDRIVEFGPFEFVHFFYADTIRVGLPNGDTDENFAWLRSDGTWEVEAAHVTDLGSTVFSDLTVVSA